MKKLMSIILACLILTGSLAACGGNSADTSGTPAKTDSAGNGAGGGKAVGGTVRIAWIGLNPDDRVDPISGITYKGSYEFKALLEKKLPGAKIEFIMVPNDGWIQKMGTTIENKEADIGWYTNQVMAAEWFVDHREFMKKDPDFPESKFEQTFTEGAKKYTRYHTFDYPDRAGAIYGLPYDVSADYIMYDKKLLSEWGVPEPGKNPTFDQLLDIIKKTTGKNPVTGKQNYGTYIRPYWCEWLGVGADLYHSISIPDMNIDKLDIAKDVDYIKDSPEVLKYFQTLQQFLACSPAGSTGDTGSEKWLTSDNDIAIMLDTSKTRPYYNHYIAKNKEVTDRFIPIFLPKGKQGKSGFPEVHHVAVTKYATNPELAWKVVKLIATDKEVLNLIFKNHGEGTVPALADASGIDNMKDEFTSVRYQDRFNSMFLTDDYWYWREPIQKVFADFFTGKLTPEQARIQFHTNVNEWIANKKKQLGK